MVLFLHHFSDFIRDMQSGRGGRSLSGWFFVLLALSAIAGTYYEFIRISLPIAMDRFSAERDRERAVLVCVHVVLTLQLWALAKVMFKRPGDVPPFWVCGSQGFSMTDTNAIRRRYCLMCHVFKPERTHHCSVCNRCVLHMDHHCPWVNNCIGFYNRKFFLLLLLYTVTLLYIFLAVRWKWMAQACRELLVTSR